MKAAEQGEGDVVQILADDGASLDLKAGLSGWFWRVGEGLVGWVGGRPFPCVALGGWDFDAGRGSFCGHFDTWKALRERTSEPRHMIVAWIKRPCPSVNPPNPCAI